MLDQAARDKAQAARAAKIAEGKAKYRTNWADSENWDRLARERGIRLPAWWIAPKPRALKTWHRKLVKAPFSEVWGCSPTRLIQLNPTMPLRAFVGQMLEQITD